MIGQICWKPLGGFKVVEEETQLHTLPLLTVALEEQKPFLPYRLKKCNQLFTEKKIRKVIHPVGFDYWHLLPQLCPYDPLPALQSLGGELALFHLKKRKIPLSTASVTLVSPSVTKQVEQSAFTLAHQVGEVILSVEKGKQRLQESLFHTLGLAPCDYRRDCDAFIYFQSNGEKNLGNHSLELHLEQVNSPDFLPIIQKKMVFLPQIPYLTQIALLLETGRISKKEIDFT